MHISTSSKLKKEFMHKYSKDFKITEGGLIKLFLGMQVEQRNKKIKLHLDYIKNTLGPKRVPMSPGIVLKPEDCPTILDQLKLKNFLSFAAKLQFAATWISFDIAFAVSQLTWFCVSAGSSQWAVLHHLMEDIKAVGLPSLQITYSPWI